MLAFHGQQAIKDKYVARMRGHQAADQFAHGFYTEGDGETFKGCAVGCCLHSGNHAAGEVEIGYPQILMRLMDGIFEALPHGDDSEFACRFLEVVEPGADLSLVWPRFAVWLLVDEEHGVLRHAKTEAAKKAIKDVGTLYFRHIACEKISEKEWRAAADAATDADTYAAAYAASNAASKAAYAASNAASNAADATTDTCAYSADATTDTCAYSAARIKARQVQAAKLLELLGQCPVKTDLTYKQTTVFAPARGL